MMSRILALASVSALAIGSAAMAQDTTAPSAAPVEAASTSLEEVVVTARRKSENLQEVPQVVSVVSADVLQKLNIQQFTDVAAVTPGLTLSTGASGYSNTASMRGVSFDTLSGASSTVAFYFNDAPVESTFVFQGLFDVGQIEVLRGPQGTVRGISAPSGAITLSSRKPNLFDYGGYVDATVTNRDGRNLQGAINVPIVKDILALRVAGLSDRNEAGGVHSLNNSADPKATTEAVRATLVFRPIDAINAEFVYQNLTRKARSFTQVSGPGNGYNGPAIAPSERLSVQDGASVLRQNTEGYFGKIDYDVLGHRLSYVGSYQKGDGLDTLTPDDLGNILPGGEVYSTVKATGSRTTHEIRLSSTPGPGRLLDYTLGVFGQLNRNRSDVYQVGAALPGAYGTPLAPDDPFAFNDAYTLPIFIAVPGKSTQKAVFGSVTAHLGGKTELTAGVRHFVSVDHNGITISTGAGRLALPLAALGLPSCAAAGLTSTYAGTCDAPTAFVGIPAGVIQNSASKNKFKPTIYNISLSHRVNRDLMVYANTGSSWRAGGADLVGPNNVGADPTLTDLIYHDPETSRSYEAGVKWTFLEGRGRLNAAVFHQEYKNLRFRTPILPYLDNNGARTIVSEINFNATADAVVDGFDVEAAFQVTPKWNVSLSGSYSDGRIDDDTTPCRDANFDGVPDNGSPTVAGFQAAGTAIALCRSGSSISRNPYWNATLRTEYATPLRDGLDGFVRALLPYSPKNARQTPARTIDGYSLLNLYAGVRSQDGAWEASLFAKNALKTDEVLDRDLVAKDTLGASAQFGSSGYYITSTTPRREIGVNIRYAFGSR
jgi:iron complex outermembrane receptor protein